MKRKSLRRQTITVIALLVLPFNILTAILGGIMLSNATRSAEMTVQSALNTQMNSIDMRIDNTIYFLYDYPSNNADYLQFLKQSDDWHYTFYRAITINGLHEDLSLSTAAQYMFLYAEAKDDLIIINADPWQTEDGDFLLVDEDVMELLTDETISNSHWHLLTIRELPFLVMITQRNGVYLGAGICLAEPIQEALSSLEYDNVRIYADTADSPESSSGLHSAVKSANIDFYLNCDIPRGEITGRLSLAYYGAIFLVLLSFLIFPVLSVFFNRFINAPLSSLGTAFAALEGGNEDYRITDSPHSAEFAQTFDSFNLMAGRLRELRLEAVRRENQRQQLVVDNLQLQLTFLQLQIRPHFLHNNMNLLYTLIQNNQNDAAQSLVLYLSEYFRYMFRKGKTLDFFSREINLIRDYLSISALHYPGAFTVSYQIDPVLMTMRIPPLLFHSFVENIIQHALIPGQTIHIILYGEYDDQLVTIQIADDGRGMDAEAVELINSGDFSSIPEGSHVGIKNAYLRMKHFYGDGASFTVESQPNNGTIFTFTIPYNLTQEADDESVDGQ